MYVVKEPGSIKQPNNKYWKRRNSVRGVKGTRVSLTSGCSEWKAVDCVFGECAEKNG